MLEILRENWVFVASILGSYGCFLKLQWDVNDMRKKRSECENRCSQKISDLKSEYNNDLDEIKADLKENVKLSQSINVSLVPPPSTPPGKGFIPPECKD